MGLANSEWNAAFRAIYRKPLVYFLEHRKEIFTTSDGQYGSKCDIKEVFASDDYKSIYNLVILLSFKKILRDADFNICCRSMTFLAYFSIIFCRFQLNHLGTYKGYIIKLLSRGFLFNAFGN